MKAAECYHLKGSREENYQIRTDSKAGIIKTCVSGSTNEVRCLSSVFPVLEASSAREGFSRVDAGLNDFEIVMGHITSKNVPGEWVSKLRATSLTDE